MHPRFGKRLTEVMFTIHAFIAIRQRENVFHARILVRAGIYIFYYLKTEPDVRQSEFSLLNVVKPASARARRELHGTLFARPHGRSPINELINCRRRSSAESHAGTCLLLSREGSKYCLFEGKCIPCGHTRLGRVGIKLSVGENDSF